MGIQASIALEALDISLEDGEAANDGHGNTDTLINVENITCEGLLMSGSKDTDAKIVGNDEDNELQGCSYLITDPSITITTYNLLIGRGGDDTLKCGLGDNYLDGGPGTDTVGNCVDEGGVIDLGLVEDATYTHPEDATGKYGKIHSGRFGDVYAKLESDVTTVGEGNTTIENILGDQGNETLNGDGGQQN